MKKAVLFLIPALILALSACGKAKDDEAIQKARERELENFTKGVVPLPKPAPLPSDMVIEVPASVKAKYSVVTLGVGNRKTREVKKFRVKIGENVPVPGTDYKIHVMSYLPDWTFKGKVVTSKSDEPKDPAIRAVIYEKGNKVFDGFIFEHNKTPSFLTDAWAIGLLGAS